MGLLNVSFDRCEEIFIDPMPEESLAALKEDYKKMEIMLFGEKVTFEEVLNGLSRLLEEIRER